VNFCPVCRRHVESALKVCPRDGERLLPVPTSMPAVGFLLDGRYRIDEQVSEGGTSVVFAARDEFDDVEAAVKILRPELVAEPWLVRHFFDEALFNRRIQHLGVLPIRDFGLSQEGHFFLAMELVDGQRLDRAIKQRGHFEFDLVLNLARALLNTLHAVHLEGVAHLDLKPENLMLVDERLQLFDFGNALPLGQQLPEGTPFMGTPSYMAPEWILDRRALAATDLYAVGLILAEALLGQTVVDAPTPEAILSRQIHEPFPYERLLAVCTPARRGRFQLFLSQMLAKDHAKRFQSALEALQFLEQHLVTRPVPLPPLEPSEKDRRLRDEREAAAALRRGDPSVDESAARLAAHPELAAPEVAQVVVRVLSPDPNQVRADLESVFEAWKDRAIETGALLANDTGTEVRLVYGWEAPLDAPLVMRQVRALWTGLGGEHAPRSRVGFSLGVGVAVGRVFHARDEEEGLPAILAESPVSIAVRLAGLQKGNSVVANRRAWVLVQDLVDAAALPPIRVREPGHVEPVYAIRGMKKAPPPARGTPPRPVPTR
jgi:serine/threonine protein kinase